MATIKLKKNIDDELRKLGEKIGRGAALRVGFLESATYPDGTSVALVAAANNFGTATIPARAFFSNMIEDKSPQWPKTLAALVKSQGVEKAMSIMGEGIRGQLQQSIRETNEPPNSPVTNLLKQRFPMGGQSFDDVLAAHRDVAAGVTAPAGKPLIHTSVMINSADYEVDLS